MKQQIYIHVGLSKTGSTFLQHQVFPKIPQVHYIPTVRFRKALSIIPQLNNQKILVSREFDQQFEEEIIKFSKTYPQAHPIIVFREPGSWALSNYKRFIKNGHPISFKEFIDIENDQGLFKVKDFKYTRYLALLEEHFENPPLVLLYEDLKANPKPFIRSISDYIGEEIDLNKINLNPKHVSYDMKSLKLVRSVSEHIMLRKKLEIHRRPMGFIYNLYANIIRYILLYGSKPLPEGVLPKKELFNKIDVDNVSKEFKKEWEYVKSIAIKIP